MTQIQEARLKLKELAHFKDELAVKNIILSKDDEDIKIPLSLFWDFKTIPGLKMKYISDYEEGTMFLCVADTDTFVEEHLHIQEEIIILMSGEVNVELTNLVTKVKSTVNLNNLNEQLNIKPNQLHTVQISKGSVFHVIFKPKL